MRVSLLVGSIASLALVDAVVAADSGVVDSAVITATRSEQVLSKIGDSITVLTADEVRKRQKTSLSDLLATTPGVAVVRNGGLGATTSLFIRGAEPEQTVVLIDGVKLNDPSAPGGGYNFAELLADDTSRVEVLRGPESTLWGSQAIGGVVNLITTVPEGPLKSSISIEGGSQETGHARARIEAGGDRVAWRLAGGYFRTGGISAFDERLGGREADGYKNTSFSGRATVTVTDAVSADLRANYWHGRNEFDGFPPPDFSFADTSEYGTTDELVAYAGLNIATLEGRWKQRIGYAYTDTDRENFDPSLLVRKTFDASGKNGRLEYQGNFKIRDGYESVFGLETERSELSTAAPSESDPNPIPLAKDVRLNSGYAQLQATPITPLTITAGLRRDDHDTFGGKTTGRAAVAYSVASQTLLRASFGQGFKAPTLYQLFSEYGNTALRPEQAHGWDAGVEQRLLDESLTLVATYFDRDTTNLVTFVSCFESSDPRCAAQPFGFYDNVTRAKATGVEFEAVLKLSERFDVSANFTRTDAENDDRNDPNFGLDLRRRPRNAANANANYRWPIGLVTGLTVQYVGERFEDASNLVPLGSYTLVDLRASQLVTDQVEVYGRIENAFDEQYETSRQYGSLGRGVFVGARASF